MKKNSFILLFCIMFFYVQSEPYFGGFFLNTESFTNNSVKTVNSLSFYLDEVINQNVKFYTRISTGFSYNPKYDVNDGFNDLSFFPLIELAFFEIKITGKRNKGYVKTDIITDEVRNFDFFKVRFGRIIAGSAILFFNNFKGDGGSIDFSVGNFSVNLFGVTNSLDYIPFFDFSESADKVIFTRWDLKRMPNLISINENLSNGMFISDKSNSKYNFYLDNDNTTDYTVSEINKINSFRAINSLAGRVFTGASFTLSRLFYQNISLYFTANIDLIPDYYVLTYKSAIFDVRNTFGGRYNSFYIGCRVDGRIIKGLYYSFDLVYQTGNNATYYSTGQEILFKDALISSFALNTKLTYYFDNILRPLVELGFSYANGDDDSVYIDKAVLNKKGDDNGYKGITSFYTGIVLSPDFRNLIVISLRSGIKPLSYLENTVYSGFYLKNELLLIMRPNLKGAGIYSEKPEYTVVSSDKYESVDKFFLGAELNYTAGYQIFSDLGVELQGGFLVPNSVLSSSSDLLWKVGLSLNVSF